MDAGIDRVLPLEFLEKQVITIHEEDCLDLEQLIKQLVQLGYERQGQVEHPGEFAVRGGIIDFYPLTEETPYRIELFGDEIDSIRMFDATNQRSIERVELVKIYPAAEIVLDRQTLDAGMMRIREDEKKCSAVLRGEFKTEEAARLRRSVEEFCENLESLQGFIGIDSYIRYFYDNTVSFFDYFIFTIFLATILGG